MGAIKQISPQLLLKRLSELHAGIQVAERAALSNAFECGRLLVLLNEKKPIAEWELPFSHDTADRYVFVYSFMAARRETPDSYPDGTTLSAFLLLARRIKNKLQPKKPLDRRKQLEQVCNKLFRCVNVLAELGREDEAKDLLALCERIDEELKNSS